MAAIDATSDHSTDVRVVSLVPSATETLLAWGVTPVAVTRFCEQPDLPTVGGTKNPDVPAIVRLSPDVVVMCPEENRLEDAERLRAEGITVHAVEIDDLADVAVALQLLSSARGCRVVRRSNHSHRRWRRRVARSFRSGGVRG